jgi:hypothetical protein
MQRPAADTSDGDRFQTRVLKVDTADQQYLQREVLGQHRDDRGRRFTDFDVAAGLPPDIQ